MMCRSFEKDNRRLIQHLLARGLTMEADGCFITPIARAVSPDRKSIRLDPRSYGYCNKETMPVDMLASCENWSPVKTRAELLSRIR